MPHKPGICPFCGSDYLDYGGMEPEDNNMVYYPWTCKNCGLQGEEWYTLEFSGHEIKDGEK